MKFLPRNLRSPPVGPMTKYDGDRLPEGVGADPSVVSGTASVRSEPLSCLILVVPF